MLLSHQELDKGMAATTPMKERLVVTPLLDPAQVGPASIDLRLGSEFLFLKRTSSAGLDISEAHAAGEGLHERVKVPLGDSLWLHPQQFVLGSTLEFVRLPTSLGGLLLGRSSWARLGLVVETAGLVQPGFAGTLTYELVNTGDSPIRLFPGLRVAQLAVIRMKEATSLSYVGDSDHPGKYVTAVGPEASRLAWDEEELEKVKRLGKTLTAGQPVAP
jgi:dCTP deaminase